MEAIAYRMTSFTADAVGPSSRQRRASLNPPPGRSPLRGGAGSLFSRPSGTLWIA